MLLKLLDKLIKKYYINIQQIINNSDNDMGDIKNEAYIILHENYDKILKNDKIFINELKTKCLKFNKYGKRIESSKRWEYFNQKEEQMNDNTNKYSNLNEDNLCLLLDIKNFIGEKDYNFLLDYYALGYKETSIKYKISPSLTRKRVSFLIDKIRKEMQV